MGIIRNTINVWRLNRRVGPYPWGEDREVRRAWMRRRKEIASELFKGEAAVMWLINRDARRFKTKGFL